MLLHLDKNPGNSWFCGLKKKKKKLSLKLESFQDVCTEEGAFPGRLFREDEQH